MKKRRSIFTYITIATAVTILSAFSYDHKNAGGKLQLYFKHTVGNELLKLDSTHYKNKLNQDYTISKFKYYVGKFIFKNSTGKDYVSENYFLINEEEPLSKQIELSNIPFGTYNAIEFIIGIDSLHNCSGAQSGALDPINGMFWAWNTGYIFLKLEGNSNSSPSPSGILEYHIGGYKQPTNCIRPIKINLTENPLRVTPKTNIIELKTDASELLKTPTDIDFSLIPVVSDSKNAELMADNYKNMFSILNIRNEN